MNVIDISLTTIGICQTPLRSPLESSTLDVAGTDFTSLLNAIMAQTGETSQLSFANMLPQQATIMPFSALTSMDQNALAALVENKSDLFAGLGELLLTMVNDLLQGKKGADCSDEFCQKLDAIIDAVGETGDPAAGNPLLSLLTQMKQETIDAGLEKKLATLIESLPESLKLKVKLHEHHDSGQASRGNELMNVQLKLVAHLFNLQAAAPVDTGLISTGGSSQLPIDDKANDVLLNRVHEQIMVKLHTVEVTPEVAQLPEALQPYEVAIATDQSGAAVTQPAPTSPNTVAVEAPGSATVADIATGTTTRAQQIEMLEGAEAGVTMVAVEAGQVSESAQSRVPLKQYAALSNEAQETSDGLSPVAAATEQDEKGSESTSSQASRDGRGSLVDVVAGQVTATGKTDVTAATGTTFSDALAQAPNPDDLVKQVVEKFDVLVNGHKSEARIQLKPEHLGELKIHLIMEQGAMRAVLDASSAQVKEVLEANLNSLKQALENQGISVRQFDVSVSYGEDRRHQDFSRFQNRSLPGVPGDENVAAEAQKVREAMRSYGNLAIDYLA